MPAGRVLLYGDECPRDLLDSIVGVAAGRARVDLALTVAERLDDARARYTREASRRRVYGYCTGLGEMYEHEGHCGPEWEHRILAEHAVQTGTPAPPLAVRAFLAVRLLQLSRGTAPVRSIVARRIAEALNHGITPVIPLYGSVGASGDLAPSAHAFLCLYYGEGAAIHGGTRMSCSEALERAGLQPLPLEPGEALALINNTAWSTGLAILAIWLVEYGFRESLSAARVSLETARCNPEHYSPIIAKLRPSRGLQRVLEALEGVQCPGGRLQDPYSLRCIPLIYGAVRDALDHARLLVEAEACSSTENPAVCGEGVLHWCGFHSVQVGLAADYARIAVSHLANTIERRIAQLMRSEITGLPPFLASPDSSVGAMMAHYTAASLAGLLRQYASPASVHSLPTSGLQEDVVPQSPNSAILLGRAAVMLLRLVALERAVARYARMYDAGVTVGRLVEEEYESLTRGLAGEVAGALEAL